jgi:hypothetical protein
MNEAHSTHTKEAVPGHKEGVSATDLTEEEYIYMPPEESGIRRLEILPGRQESSR